MSQFNNDVLVANGITNERDAVRLLTTILDTHTAGESFGNNVRGGLTQMCWNILKNQQPHPWIETERRIGSGLCVWEYTCEGTPDVYQGGTAQQQIILEFMQYISPLFIARYARYKHEDVGTIMVVLQEVSTSFEQKIGKIL